MQTDIDSKILETWNKIFLYKDINACIDSLNGLGITDIKVMKLTYLNPKYQIKDYLSVLKVPNSTFTNIINRLVKKGLIVRNLSKDDLRSFSLELTPFGVKGINEHFDAEKKILNNLMLSFSTIEKQEFIRLLNKIAE